MSDVVIIGGPPGTGKTHLARGLAAGVRSGVHLEADAFFHLIVSGYLPPWLPESDAQNRVVNTAVARAASAYANGGYTVVIDGINGPWFLEHLVEHLEPLNGGVHYLIVRCEPDVAVERVRRRPDRASAVERYGADIDEAAVRFMHDQFLAAPEVGFRQLDTTRLTPAETLAAGRALLGSGELRLAR